MARNYGNGSQALFEDLNFKQDPNEGMQIKPAGRKPKEPEVDPALDYQQKMTVKRGFYLTPQISDALNLRRACTIGAQADFSRIVNLALEEYLSEEVTALREAQAAHEQDVYSSALAILMRKKLGL